uniref:Paraoxonase n=1 Tax=Monodelphis domestica TaxID=13616 RepID=A0A5F8HFY8_MONDO
MSHSLRPQAPLSPKWLLVAGGVCVPVKWAHGWKSRYSSVRGRGRRGRVQTPVASGKKLACACRSTPSRLVPRLRPLRSACPAMAKLLKLMALGLALAFLGERFVTFRRRMNVSHQVLPVEPPSCHLIQGLDRGGAVFLYVVNHPRGMSTVEIFEFQGDALLHLKTITHELLSSVNDIVVLGQERFYATNDHYFTGHFLSQLELFLDLQWTNVVYYSPDEVKEVASGLGFANGIALSPDRKHVYVAAVTAHSIHVMERHDDWRLTPQKVLHVGTLVDNLSVDPATGDVWAGCHPNGMKLLAYDPADPPGSEVLRIRNILSPRPAVSTVYANNGSVLQGSTVAAVHGHKMLVGTVFHKALCCDLRAPGGPPRK